MPWTIEIVLSDESLVAQDSLRKISEGPIGANSARPWHFVPIATVVQVGGFADVLPQDVEAEVTVRRWEQGSRAITQDTNLDQQGVVAQNIGETCPIVVQLCERTLFMDDDSRILFPQPDHAIDKLPITLPIKTAVRTLTLQSHVLHPHLHRRTQTLLQTTNQLPICS